MAKQREVLIFAATEDENTTLRTALNDLQLKQVSPGDLTPIEEVSVAIVDRAPAQAVKICTNLRRQQQFAQIPILVLLDGGAPEEISRLAPLGVDLLFKPVTTKALRRYLNNALSKTVSGSAPTAPPNDERAIKPADTETQSGFTALPGQAESGLISALAGEPAISDSIPAASLTLRPADSGLSELGDFVLCSRCNRWECRRDDRFCSMCGAALAVLEFRDESIVLEPLGEHRVGSLIGLRNPGQNPLLLGFQVTAPHEIAGRFSLAPSSGILDGGLSAELLVTFDARGLDLTKRRRAFLETRASGNGHRRQTDIIVEPLAIAAVSARSSYQYAIGSSTEWEFQVANNGGGTLLLSRVLLDDIGLTPSAAVAVKGGDSKTVRLKIPLWEISAGTHQKTTTWDFGPRGSLAVDLSIDVVRPPRITVQPLELDFGIVSTSRSPRLPLTLINSGGDDLIIESLISSFDGAECAAPAPIRIPEGASRIVEFQIRGSADLEGEHAGEILIGSNSHQSRVHRVPFRVRFVTPGPYEEYIGIDFGTSASCVAVLDRNRRPFVIDLERLEPESSGDSRIMPSVLFFHAGGDISVGIEALDHALIEPANAITSIKRVLGIKSGKRFRGREYTATELASEVIKQLVRRTEDGLFQFGDYKTPSRAVVTIPVEFLTNQRIALVEACKLGGLSMSPSSHRGIIIDEAHAAALDYLTKRVREDGSVEAERLLIFDFGGGTLDCALIDISSVDGKILVKTLAPGGDPNLGGEDIDWALVRRLGTRASKEFSQFEIDCLSDDEKAFAHRFRDPLLFEAASNSRAGFKRQAEAAKIALSNAAQAEVVIEPLLSKTPTTIQPFVLNGDGRARFAARLDRREIEQAASPFVDRAVESIEAICEKARVAPESVNTILHVGRTSLIPLVRTRVIAALPNAIDRSDLIEPKLCVAMGAAYWGYIKDRPGANIEFIGVTDRLIHDIGYIDVKGLKEVFNIVFPAYTEIPLRKRVEITRKEEVVLRLAENRGKSRGGTDRAVEIGVVRIDCRNTTNSAIQVEFSVDENRVLEITAGGRTHRITEIAEDERGR
jgi:molecular chaperone DnaK (HSP70)